MQNWKRIVYTIAAIQIGTGISIIGVVAFIPLFLTSELGVTDPGEAAFWAGLISGVTPFFVAIAAPFWSMQADRRGPRFALSMILFILGVVIALMYFTRSPVELLILRMIQGMFGPLVGGMIADTMGYRMPFVIFCALSFFCLAAVRLMVPKQIGQEQARGRESFVKQLSYFMKNPVVRLMVMLQFLCNCGMTGIGPILPLYIKEMMGGDAMAVATIVGTIIFIAGATSVTSSLNVSRLARRVSMPRILIIASLVTGVNFILQYLMPEVWTLGFMRGLTGFSLGMIMPLANTILASVVPAEKRTMVVGFSTSFALMGNVAGPMASGAIAMQWGYGMVFWSTAFCFFLAACVIYRERKII